MRTAPRLHDGTRMSHLTWWHVFVLVLALAIAFLGGKLIGRAVHRLLYRLSLVTHTQNDRVVSRLQGPVALVCMVVIWHFTVSWFDLPSDVLAFARGAGGIALLVALAWGGMRVIDAAIESFAVRSKWITGHRVSQSLLPLARRIAKVITAVIAAIMILDELGYSVGPLIAGLGVTGIAVALAAQSTLANLFGAFAIGADHPFREGDTIKLDNGRTGVVEAIGLRSTRLRTTDGTLLTVPNGKLADSQIELLSASELSRRDTAVTAVPPPARREARVGGPS